MLVAKHKCAKDGPAICPMLPMLHKYMEIYVHRMRPLFAQEDEDALFVTNEGVHFLEGTIGRRLPQFILKCGVNLGRRMAFVDMRKLITTEMLDRATPEEQAILRRVLAHSEKTSRDWYTRPDLTNVGINAAQIIQCLLDANDKAQHLSSASNEKASMSKQSSNSGKDVTGRLSTSPADEPNYQLPTSPTRPSPVASEKPTPSSPAASTRSQLPSDGTPSEASTLVSGRVPPSPVSKTLSAFQKQQLEKVFKAELEGQLPLTMEVAQRKMSLNTILSPMSSSHSRVKQVVNYINYLRKQSQRTATPTAAEPKPEPEAAKVLNWLDDFDDPSTRSSRRSEWDAQDTKRLETAFKDFTKLPATAHIRTIMRGKTELHTILKREGWTRVYNKIKNMFKKKNKN